MSVFQCLWIFSVGNSQRECQRIFVYFARTLPLKRPGMLTKWREALGMIEKQGRILLLQLSILLRHLNKRH